VAADETSLERLVNARDVERSLSRSGQRRKEEELRTVEASREEHEREEGECVDLQPVPTD
jgi:hypothetical protein